MVVVKVEGVHGPLTKLVTSAWKVDDRTYRIILDKPDVGKFIVITVDVAPVLEASIN